MPFWIKKAKEIGLTWKDMNKLNGQGVVGSGGVVSVLAFIIGVLLFVAYRTFITNSDAFLIEILALTSVVLFLAGIGLIDDLFGWQKGGLRRRHRIVLVLLAAIPLMAINAGRSEVSVPFIGLLDLGLLYPLIIIPIGILGATTTYNFLAGANGLEAGQGIIILTAMAFISFFMGNSWLSVICLCMVFSLLGFMIYNFYPAKVFPGDSITYSIGGLLAIMAILGNFEKIAIVLFIPYILEFVLKIRGKLTKYSFGEPKKDGSLTLKYDKIYSLNHLSIYLMEKLKIRPSERKVVLSIWLFQIIIALAVFAFANF